jgi:putative intracellular protease/amidase
MAQLPYAFNAHEVAPQDDYSPIPDGDYAVLIEDSEMKDTKAGTGQYLQFTLSVIDGQYAGRKLWERLNLVNPNQTAVDIAQRTLSAICHATGVMAPQDSAELHGKTMVVKVGRDKNNADQNTIKAYKRMDGARPAPAQSAAPPRASAPAATQPAAASAPPWARTGK